MREDGGYAIADKVPLGKTLLYSLQHLMAFVGMRRHCPRLDHGLDACARGVCTGIGTIIYLICTRNRVPSISACLLASLPLWPSLWRPMA